MTERFYRCVFIVNGTQYVVDAKNLRDLKEGFWVNNKFKIADYDDRWMWIMPHKIDFISCLQSSGEVTE